MAFCTVCVLIEPPTPNSSPELEHGLLVREKKQKQLHPEVPLLSQLTPALHPPVVPRWRPSGSWSTPRSLGQSPQPPPPARWTSRFSADVTQTRTKTMFPGKR